MTSRPACSWVPRVPPLRQGRPEGEGIGGRTFVAPARGNRALAAAMGGRLVRGALRPFRGARANRARPVVLAEQTGRLARPSGTSPG